MSILRRVQCLSLTLTVVAAANAQVVTPLNPGDPFSISSGSTFSASGGVRGGGASIEKPTRIAAELREAQQIIQQNHIDGNKTASSSLIKSAMEAMLHALDPHSNFHDQGEWSDLLDEQRSGYSGIGATIANYRRGGSVDTYVLSTHPGSPAAKARLKYGDRVIAINGERMAGKESDEVRDKIRGANGTTFRLTVERAATNQLETIEIRRGRVPQPSIPDAYILRPEIGYIQLSDGFNYTTSEEFDTALSELKKLGMKSLILDLRGNGGGIVDQAVKVAEKFLPAGTLILTQRGRSRIDNRVWKSTNKNPEDMPLVVLVDEDTASASEIVAGAFQDDDRAIIVGEKTFGKGLVQSVIDLPGKTGLTLTSARYLTPSGRSIQRDYSKIDLYDYYNNKTPAGGVGPFFEARTVTDRRVIGGDGIQPDEVVNVEDLSDSEIRLVDPVFLFSRELVNGRILGQEGYRSIPLSFGKRITPGDFPMSDSLFASFVAYATRPENGGFDATLIQKYASFIRLRIRYHVIIASFGAVSADQVLIEDDLQVAKAVESIPISAQLAQKAAKARRK